MDDLVRVRVCVLKPLRFTPFLTEDKEPRSHELTSIYQLCSLKFKFCWENNYVMYIFFSYFSIFFCCS